jgi:putative ABC transport system permease protein
VLAIAVEVTMILTLVGVSYGTLDGTAQRTRGVGADILLRPPGSSAIGLSSAPMSDKIPALLIQEPHVTFAMGTMVQPLSGLDSMTGLDIEDFKRLNGGFQYLQGGPLVNDDDIIVDEYYARQKHLKIGDVLNLVNHDWKLSGIYEGGKLARICVKSRSFEPDFHQGG